MENEELKQYLIDFAVKALNECEIFSKVFGSEFVRKRLEQNLDAVYVNAHTDNQNGKSFYCMDKDSVYNNCIVLFSHSDNVLTIGDIESNKKLQHDILHELIHAIFRKTKEECETLDIEDGTGILEFYSNNTELGRGLNEGLTEWICYKAGYGGIEVYPSETNIIRILELALGEDAIINLANGNIKENISHLLQMSEQECRYVLTLIDKIHQTEMDAYKTHGSVISTQDEILDKRISHFEATIFGKYFGDEISQVQNAETISRETMKRIDDLYFCIKGGQTDASKLFNSRLPLQFKHSIYPELMKKYNEPIVMQFRNKTQIKEEDTNLPIVYRKKWFQKLQEVLMQKFIKKTYTLEPQVSIKTPNKKTSAQVFKDTISDMSNYLGKFVPKDRISTTNSLKLQKGETHKSSEHDL